MKNKIIGADLEEEIITKEDTIFLIKSERARSTRQNAARL
jgi:hypothetical protein